MTIQYRVIRTDLETGQTTELTMDEANREIAISNSRILVPLLRSRKAILKKEFLSEEDRDQLIEIGSQLEDLEEICFKYKYLQDILLTLFGEKEKGNLK